MATSAFAFTASATITAQPNSSGEKLIFRSDNASDTGNLSVVGLVAAVSTSETNALTGKREVQTTNTFTSLSTAKLSAAQTGNVTIYGQGTKASGDLRIDTNPANNDTLLIGLTGFTQTYTFKTTLTGAANEVKIGALTSDTATNLSAAINAGAGAGTTYGTGTAANAYVTATVASSVVTLTDKLAVSRQLAWAISQGVGATISIRTLIGGAMGALLGTISSGATQIYNSFTLNSEALSTNTLPALVTGTSAAIYVGGKTCALRFKGSGISSAVTVNYQVSTDSTNWATGAVSITSIANTMTVAAPQRIIPTEQNVEYIRLNVTANANTVDTAIDARVIYG